MQLTTPRGGSINSFVTALRSVCPGYLTYTITVAPSKPLSHHSLNDPISLRLLESRG